MYPPAGRRHFEKVVQIHAFSGYKSSVRNVFILQNTTISTNVVGGDCATALGH